MALQTELGLITAWVFKTGGLSKIYIFYICVHELDGDLVVYYRLSSYAQSSKIWKNWCILVL